MPYIWNGQNDINTNGLNVKEWFRNNILIKLQDNPEYICEFIIKCLRAGVEIKELMIQKFCNQENHNYLDYCYYYPENPENERIGLAIIGYVFNDALQKLVRKGIILPVPNDKGNRIGRYRLNNQAINQGNKKVCEKNDSSDEVNNQYTADDFLSEVYMSKKRYNELVKLMERKKNIILQGAPGVGKTFAAKRLAYSIMGEKNEDRVKVIQFHQSYSYEDFIMGYRPNENGFELRKGPFYDFCKTAEKDSGNPYYFIIDEINRGNLSKIFGELFMLIESDKRGESINCLLYDDNHFSVPKNLYIIGMLNTADRSLAMLDYALRRRFAFFELTPGFDTDKFKEYISGFGSDLFNNVIKSIKDLNNLIKDRFGAGFCIGHSYFCNLKSENLDQQLSSIINYEIMPLIEEYCFDDNKLLEEWKVLLLSAFPKQE